MNEEKAVAICMANYKGSKQNKPSNLLEWAVATRTLIQLWGIKKMSEYFGVVPHQIRQVDKVNELRPEVRELARSGVIGVEDAYQLWRVGRDKQYEASRAIIDAKMNSDEARKLVHLLRETNGRPVNEAKELILKTRVGKIDLLVMPLTATTFGLLKERATQAGLGVHDFALKVLEDYLYGKKG